MRVKLPINEYTQINTDENAYIIQNIGNEQLYIVFAASKPADDLDYTFIIPPLCGITDSHKKGIVWGKPKGKLPVEVAVENG